MVKNIINSAMDEYSQKVYGPNGIAFNSPNKLQYDIDANAAAARVPSQIAEQTFPGMPGQVLGTISDLAMPALALGSSPFYDVRQAFDRAIQENPVSTTPYGMISDTEIPQGPSMVDIGKAIYNENIPSSMMGRTLGAGKNLADRFGRITDGIGNLFFSPAGAAEINPNNTFTSSIANSPYEADYMPPNRYTNFDPRVGQDKFNITLPAAEEKLSLFQKGKDLASSGIGKAGKLGIDTFNLLKNNNPIGFLTSGIGNLFSGLGNMFERRDGMATVDEFGNLISGEELDKQNALGGYYTDAARSSRRRSNSIKNMLARKAAGKKIGENRLASLQEQEAKQEAARQAAFDAIMSSQQSQQNFYDSLNDGAGATSTTESRSTAGDAPGYSGPSPFAKGGIATMFVEKR